MGNWTPYPRYTFRKELALELIKDNIPKNYNFLEIGCASGDFGINLGKIGYSGLMIDFSENAQREVIEKMSEFNIKNKISFKKINLFDFNKKEKFNFILFFEVLEHIKDEEKAIKKVKSLLSKNGFLIISVPSRKKLWGANDVLAGHERRYEKDELIKLLNRNNFKIIKILSYGYPWLNLIKLLRDKYAKKRIIKEKLNKLLYKENLTKESGLSPIGGKFLKKISPIFFNKYFLFFPMQFSKIFNNYDLAEGYLCLAQKI